MVSASSSDREFGAVKFRRLIPQYSDCHKDIFVRNTWLLNSGFPLNFDGEKNSVPPKKIQLTRALIFSAVCLAIQNKYKNCFVEFDNEVQKKIINEFKELQS